jgi:hypothetical protein
MSELALRVLASSVSIPRVISGAANQSKKINKIKQNKKLYYYYLKKRITTTTTICHIKFVIWQF